MGSTTNLKDVQKIEFEALREVDIICRENQLSYSLAFGSVLGAVRHKGFIPWDDDIDIMVDIDNYQHFCEVLSKKLPQAYCVYSYDSFSTYQYLFSRIGLRNIDHTQIYIDIFPMVGLPKSSLGRKLYVWIAFLIFRGYFIKKIKPDIIYSTQPNKRKIASIYKALLAFVSPGIFIKLYKKMQKAFPISNSEYLYNFCGAYGYKEIVTKAFLRDLVYMDFEGYPFPVPKDWDKYLAQIYGDYMTPKKINYV